MNRVLVAHGTRHHRGVAMVGDLARRVSIALGAEVRVAFVDVLGPTPDEVLRGLTGPVLLMPAFLARGYHVTTDIPSYTRGHRNVTVADPLGPCPHLARVLADRVFESGWRFGDSVVLAAAGTSDLTARRDLHTMAVWMSALTGSRVELAFVAGTPSVADAVDSLRRRGARRVVVASYLLSDGLFHERVRDSGADVVTEPLATHDGLVRLVANRFRRTRVSVAA